MIQSKKNKSLLQKTLFLLFFLALAGKFSALDLGNMLRPFIRTSEYFGSICRPSENVLSRFLQPEVTSSNIVFSEAITRLLAENAPYYSFLIYDPYSGYRSSHSPGLKFHAASTYKTMILLAIMRMVQREEHSLDTMIKVDNEFISIWDKSSFSIDDPEDSLHAHVGEFKKLFDLLEEMIVSSSNIATNLVISFANPDTLNRELEKMGISGGIVRGVADDKAYENCLNNYVSAEDLIKAYMIINESSHFNAESRKIIFSLLGKTREVKGISRDLPNSVLAAHKYGHTSKVYHDAGFFMPEDQKIFYISIMTSDYEDLENIRETFARIGLMAYREIMHQRYSLPHSLFLY